MNIDDFQVEAKKYISKSGTVILNITIEGCVDIRGYRAINRNIHGKMVWLVSPPSTDIRSTGKPFWIVQVKDKTLWALLAQKMINTAETYASLTQDNSVKKMNESNHNAVDTIFAPSEDDDPF